MQNAGATQAGKSLCFVSAADLTASQLGKFVSCGQQDKVLIRERWRNFFKLRQRRRLGQRQTDSTTGKEEDAQLGQQLPGGRPTGLTKRTTRADDRAREGSGILRARGAHDANKCRLRILLSQGPPFAVCVHLHFRVLPAGPARLDYLRAATVVGQL